MDIAAKECKAYDPLLMHKDWFWFISMNKNHCCGTSKGGWGRESWKMETWEAAPGMQVTNEERTLKATFDWMELQVKEEGLGRKDVQMRFWFARE